MKKVILMLFSIALGVYIGSSLFIGNEGTAESTDPGATETSSFSAAAKSIVTRATNEVADISGTGDWLKMKKLILILFSVCLGAYLFNLIIGDDEDSLKRTTANIWEQNMEDFKQIPWLFRSDL